MNVLFPRIPLWDPDRFLKRWMPIVRIVLQQDRRGHLAASSSLGALRGARARVGPHQARGRSNSIAPGNWLWLWAVFVFVKLIHELGHAFACRRFGGECHELGIMFLVLHPHAVRRRVHRVGVPQQVAPHLRRRRRA